MVFWRKQRREVRGREVESRGPVRNKQQTTTGCYGEGAAGRQMTNRRAEDERRGKHEAMFVESQEMGAGLVGFRWRDDTTKKKGLGP